MSEKINQLVLHRIRLEELLLRSEYENQQLRFECIKKDIVDQKVKMLELKLRESNASKRDFEREIRRLSKIESEYHDESENGSCIAKLIQANNELEKSFFTIREIFDEERAEFHQQMTKNENRYALLDVQCNCLIEDLLNEKRSIELIRNDLERPQKKVVNFLKDFLKCIAAFILFAFFFKLINYI